MKYLVLSDIHGNMDALESVLLELEEKSIKFDKCLVLGDLVGYCANPDEVVKRIMEIKPEATVRGNHDKVAGGISDGRDFNYAAREAAFWTRNHLSPESKEYVAKLPKGPVKVGDLIHIVHGSPWDEDYYIFSWREAAAAFERSDGRIIFFGHTHVPAIWSLDGSNLEGEGITDDSHEYLLEEDKRYLINPGSVGQPRDSNPKSSLAIFDIDEMKIQFFRIEYDIKSAQRKIRKTKLAKYLADRLATGM